MTSETTGTGASAEAEEAAWELATAERLRMQGDLVGAASWYRRAADHLMDAGEDDRALAVLKTAAELTALDAASRSAPAVTAERAPPAPVPAPLHPEAPPAPSPFAPAASAAPAALSASVVPAALSASVVPAPSAATGSRRPMSYLPARVAEADAVAARLPALPLFGELPAESLRSLARQAILVRFAPGEIVADGASIEGPLLVLTGGEAVAQASPEQPGVPLGAGDFAGELGAYYGGLRVVTVRAETPVEAVAFAPSLVRVLSRDFPAFRDALEEAVWDWAFAALPWAAPLFRRLDSAARAAVYERFERVGLREGDALMTEGVDPGAVWLVAAGEVEVYGGELGLGTAHRARAGDALGVASALTGEPGGVSARAVRGVLAARIDAAAFRALVDEEPVLAVALGDVGVTGRGVVS